MSTPIFAQSVPAFVPRDVLDRPLADLIDVDELRTFEFFFRRECPGFRYARPDVVRNFVEPKFYRECLRHRRTVSPADSPFHQKRRTWEQILLRTLARHALTVNMTTGQIEDFGAGRRGPLMQSIHAVVVAKSNGRRASTGWLPARGIYFVADFLRAHEEERDLAPEHRFISGYKTDLTTPAKFKAAVDRMLVDQLDGTAPGPGVKHDVVEWLSETRLRHAHDPVLSAACDALLKHVGGGSVSN